MASQSNKAAASFLTIVLNGLAAVCGVASAFLLAPLLFEASRESVFDYAEEHYWDWLAYPAEWAWFALCLLGTYFAGHLLMLCLCALVGFLLTLRALHRR